MSRKSLHIVVLALALVVLTSSAWAVNGGPSAIWVTGNFFAQRPALNNLCAQTWPGYYSEVKFTGVTPYCLEFTAGPQCTNSVGKVCIRAPWPQGVYKVKAKVLPVEVFQNNSNGCVKSGPSALSIFNANNFCGAQGGGSLNLFSYDVPPNIKNTLSGRPATFAYIFKQSVPQNYGVWYFDNFYPLGAVQFAAQSFTDIYFDQRQAGNVSYKVVEVYGNGCFSIKQDRVDSTVGSTNIPDCLYDCQPVHYYIYADDYPGDSSFRIKIWDFSGALLYQSAPDGDWPQTTVYNGKNIIAPCP